MRRPERTALLLPAACLLCLACNRQPIVIGASLGLTGPSSAIGVQGRNGIEMAVEEINRSGGIRGRPVELIVENDGETAEGGLAAVRSLIDRGAAALVGTMTSAAASLARGYATERRVVLLSPTASSADFSGQDDYFFRIIGSNDAQGVLLAEEALRRGYRTAAIVQNGLNDSYTKAVGFSFEKRFEAGGGAVLSVRTIRDPPREDFAELARRLAEEAPDLVLCSGNSFDLASLGQAFASEGRSVPLFGSMWARTPDLFTFGGRTLEGTVLTAGADAQESAPGIVRFVEKYKKEYGDEPGFGAIYGYEAMRVLAAGIAAALEKAGVPGGPGVKEALLGLADLPSLHGTIAFDAYGDTDRPYYLFEIRNGTFHRLP